MRRTLLAASLLATLLAPLTAFAQAPPAVPALPDSERRTSYSITGSTCACAVNFALYGDGTDVDSWLEVWVNGVQKLSTDPTFGWSLSSVTGPLATIPRPITDAVLTFNAVQTGTVQIVGARRPRQLSQFTEGRGVAARDLNQRFTDLTAIERELWDKTADLTGRGLFFAPGDTTGPMPQPSACQSKVLGFDSSGLNPVCFTLGNSGPLLNTIDGAGATSITNGTTTQCAYDSSGTVAFLPCGLQAPGTTANDVQIAPSNCHGVVVETGAFKTITLPASLVGFPSSCPVRIVNGNASRGQKLSGFPASLPSGCGGACLWPSAGDGGNSLDVDIVSGAWAITRPPGRWRVTAPKTFYVNSGSGVTHNAVVYGAGSDNCDGLDPSCPLQHIQTAINYVQGVVDYGVGMLTNLTSIQAACNTDGAPVTYTESLSMFGVLNATEDFTLLGDASDPDSCLLQGNGSYAISVDDLGVMSVQGFKIKGAGGGFGPITVLQNGVLDLSNVDINVTSNSQNGILVQDGGNVNIKTNITVSGTAVASMFASDGSGSRITIGGPSITIASAIAGTQFYESSFLGQINASGVTFTNPGNFTGNQCSIAFNATLNSGATLATIPGTASSCATSNGGQKN